MRRPPSRDRSRAGAEPLVGPVVEAGLQDEESASDDLKMTLNVIRVPSKGAEETPQESSIQDPPAVLRQAMDRADLEHRRVLGEVREAFYFGGATPTVLPIDRRTAHQLRMALGLSAEVVGMLGPGTIHRGEVPYKVWVRLQLCG
jgi:hypothetical protein